MGIRAGDIRKCKWYGRELDPAPDIDLTIMLPGIVVTSVATGNRKMHSTGKAQLGGFDGGSFSCSAARKDLEFLQAKQTASVPGPFELTLVSGETYVGQLLPEGELTMSTGGGTMAVAGRGETFAQVV
jgi:hypothetical protein